MRGNHTRTGILLAAASALAQAQTGGPAFEVASVKPSGPKSVRGSSGGPGTSDPGRYTFGSATLEGFIAIAYHVDYFQISSKVPLDEQRFDLVAKLPEGTTREQFRVMMQNLLAERFHLKVHMLSKEFAAYELVVAKGGPKLKEAAPGNAAAPRSSTDDGFPDLPPNRPGMASHHTMRGGYEVVRMRAQREPVSQLADFLPTPDNRPVVDKTGLTGKYDFTLEFTLDRQGASRDEDAQLPVAPSLFTALQQQLGLQLVDKKIPFDVVVVDSVDKLPTEN